jgi:hypothetical protein
MGTLRAQGKKKAREREGKYPRKIRSEEKTGVGEEE